MALTAFNNIGRYDDRYLAVKRTVNFSSCFSVVGAHRVYEKSPCLHQDGHMGCHPKTSIFISKYKFRTLKKSAKNVLPLNFLPSMTTLGATFLSPPPPLILGVHASQDNVWNLKIHVLRSTLFRYQSDYFNILVFLWMTTPHFKPTSVHGRAVSVYGSRPCPSYP